ncbi:hypothetical protein JL722_4601 [Aureococcus anophagefferens]|nr:hypothetical protein JL722_4601 [Aureococcus anophagefferens]
MIRDSKVVQSVCYDRDSEEELLGAVHPQDAHMNHEGKNPHHVGKEDTPAYRALNAANVLCTEHRRKDVSDIFTGVDRPANTDRVANLKTRSPYFLLGPLGCCAYHCTHTELFVPAGHVGFLMDDKNQYLFAQPGMVTPAGAQIELMTWRNLKMIYVRAVAPQPAPAGLSAAAVSEPPWPEPQPRVEAMEIFAGSGSMSRALRDGGASVVATCENDPRKAGALANSLPGVHNYGDIHDDSIVGHLSVMLPSPYVPIGGPAPRRRGAVAVVLVAAALVVALQLPRLRTAAPSLATTSASAAGAEEVGFEKITIYADDLLAHENVCYWVKRTMMVQDCYNVPETLLSTMLPRQIVVRFQRERVERSIGEQASEGYVAFNLQRQDRTSQAVLTCSWLVVMTLLGEIRTIVPFGTWAAADDDFGPAPGPPPGDDGFVPPPFSGDDDATGAGYYGSGGFKSWNDREFLIAAGVDTSWDGYLYKFDWRTGNFTLLLDEMVDVHDAQRAADGDRAWVLLSGEYEFGEVSLDGDATELETKVERVASANLDFNHLQLVDDDAHAVISSRTDSTIYKCDPAADQSPKVWALGGPDGDYDIVGLDGTVYPAGDSYWSGQHNAEYIGDDEYAMFNNNWPVGVGPTNNSELLVVHLDPADTYATVVWSYDTNTKTEEYGDNDLLPTGNMLGCWWQTLAVEIEFFGGEECTAGTCLVNASWPAPSSSRRVVVDAVAFSLDVAHRANLNASIGATAGFAVSTRTAPSQSPAPRDDRTSLELSRSKPSSSLRARLSS